MKIDIYIDGAARGNPGPAGLGVVFKGQKGTVLGTLHQYIGITTNNVAEYTALLKALKEAKRRGYDRLNIYTDSQLMERQLKGIYRVKSDNLQTLFDQAQELLSQFKIHGIMHLPRQRNREADLLANLAIDEIQEKGGKQESQPEREKEAVTHFGSRRSAPHDR